MDETRKDETAVGEVPHSRICLVERDARKGTHARVIVEGHGTAETTPQETLASFGELLFSPDSKTLYFTSAAWVTSGAAHAVDIATGTQRFLFDGSVAAVITEGPYKGHLLASHFRLDHHPIDSPKYRGRIETWTVESVQGTTIAKLPEDEAARARALKGRP